MLKLIIVHRWRHRKAICLRGLTPQLRAREVSYSVLLRCELFLIYIRYRIVDGTNLDGAVTCFLNRMSSFSVPFGMHTVAVTGTAGINMRRAPLRKITILFKIFSFRITIAVMILFFYCSTLFHISSSDKSTFDSLMNSLFETKPGKYDKMYGKFSESERLEMLRLTQKTFIFAYDNYMKFAMPLDELNPLFCSGRGPDLADRSNININDVLGNYSLTLVDSLDTLAVMGNYTEFKRAVKLVVENVTFDQDSIVQVFEATIRVLGGLLSAHMLIVDQQNLFSPEIRPIGYNNSLIYLAKDLAVRLLPALEQSKTGIPLPRVHLRDGVPNSTSCHWCRTETCPAGAGSLLLEFGILSRILGDPRFEIAAKRAVKSLWACRADTGLFGNAIDAENSKWIGEISGIGAGIDSFYEYLLKSWVAFGDNSYYFMFRKSYESVKQYLRRGRAHCNSGVGPHPFYVNANMHNGRTMTNWIDSLSAAWAGVQLLAGDVEESICTHVLYFNIWRRFDFLPERFNWKLAEPEIAFYPLRPELAESTYLLYQATKNPFYLHVGRHMLLTINNYTRAKCGYATVHDVREKSLEDRMESFFLSETCKYLYLLFDKENPLNKHSTRYLFSTQGHIFPLHHSLRVSYKDEQLNQLMNLDPKSETNNAVPNTVMNETSSSSYNCDRISDERRFLLPLKDLYFAQLSQVIGVQD